MKLLSSIFFLGGYFTVVVLATSFNPQNSSVQLLDLASEGTLDKNLDKKCVNLQCQDSQNKEKLNDDKNNDGNYKSDQKKQDSSDNKTNSQNNNQSNSKNSIEIELNQYDPALKDIKVKANLNSEKTQATLIFEGDICTDCSRITLVSINPKDLESFDFLKTFLAKTALDHLKKPTLKPSKSSKKKNNSITSDCDTDDLDSGVLTCLKDEIASLVEECENIDVDLDQKEEKKQALKLQRKCFHKVDQHYLKFTKPILRKYMFNPLGSEFLMEALEVRNELIENLPDRFNQSIRLDLINISRESVLHRAHLNYQTSLMTGASPSIAATQAKMNMLNEMFYNNPYSFGGNLLHSLFKYSRNSSKVSWLQVNQSFLQHFYQPLLQYWGTDHSKGLSPIPSFLDQINNPDIVYPSSTQHHLENNQGKINTSTGPSIPQNLHGTHEVPRITTGGQSNSTEIQIPTNAQQIPLRPGAAIRRIEGQRINR